MKSINENNEIIENYKIEEDDDEERFFTYREREREKKTKIKDEMNIRFLSK